MTSPAVEPERVDFRSVGELLLDADLTARAALWDPDADLAKARVRTWGEVVEAAADLWAAIPDPSGDPTMGRIRALAEALHRTHRRTQWPGAGPGDPHLESVAASLARAAELVSVRRHPTAPLSTGGHLDADAARTRLKHVLYVSAHSVGVALNAHTRHLRQRLDARKTLPAGDSLRHARDATDRIGAVERLAGSYLHPRWPAALTGEHRETTEVTRLEQALARWDLQAHRTLAGPPSVANLHRIARVQQDLTVATAIIAAAAATRGVVDAAQHAGQLRPALAGLEHAWGRLAADLEPLLGRQRRLDPELLPAANVVHAALRDITHQHAGIATPAAMAARVDLDATTRSMHRNLAATVDLAHVVRDALEDPDLTVAARGIHVLAATGSAPRPPAAWIDAGDLHHNRDVHLPHLVRASLTAHAEELIAAAITADFATPAVHQPSVAALAPSARGGRHEDRNPQTGDRAALRAGIGCER